MASSAQITPDTPVTVKVNIGGVARRFKLPLRDVGINVLESKLRSALSIPADSEAVFERYSDSAAAYVVLDQANTAVYKQLYRAAKAKHKLKLRVTVKEQQTEEKPGPQPASVADAADDENHPSVEPTDTERETEQPTVADSTLDSEEQATAGAAADTDHANVGDNDTRSVEAAVLDKRPAVPEEATPQARSDIPYRTIHPCVMPCPSLRANYAVCCNSCDRTIPDAHYHCSTCDDGDFDLCQDCVDRGITCKGANHWLIKRFVKNGVIINSTTERLAPKPRLKPAPSAPERVVPVFNELLYANIRTCNCCVQEMPEAEFVHCTTCDDYDLCRACFAKNRHGHHPKHAFIPAVEGTRLEPEVAFRLAAGRGQPHNAICDGCDNGIRGVRHKCLDCPDWDYCAGCVVNASLIHPGHRFVPIYEPLPYVGGASLRSTNRPVHVGICCDGPLCSVARSNSSYIVGDRYKCAVCHDTDFCQSCEASPANDHNRTHPLIKFKTPVRHVNVTTTGENPNGRPLPAMGDRRRPGPAAVNVTRAMERSTSPSLVSGVQTVVDVQPSEPVKADEKEVPVEVEKTEEKSVAGAKLESSDDLFAMFVRDTITDGTVFGPDHVFEQTWVLRNTGKVAWPAGCSVKFVGGDYMGHLDSNHPAATSDVAYSCESTICYASIQPGEEFPFTVLLRTPHRSGRVVSNWRLTTNEGLKFGHRLWCDVVVEKPKVVLPPPTVTEAVKQEEDNEKKEDLPETKPEVEPEHSQMIFPKLEKESPVASVHEEIKADSESAQENEGEVDYEEPVQEDDYEADFDESNWDKQVDGFLTDEEYDILDASDEEYHLDGPTKQK